VYVAPPDHHLLIQPSGTLRLSQTNLVNYARPAADPLFESIARSFPQRAIAVVLTGMGHDGAKGIQAIKQAGGITMAQSVRTAQFSSMPQAAIHTRAVDLVLPLDQIPLKLMDLVMGTGVTEGD
jgi:two-component system, chemotaxis family, protein-glutamate methylesterase/glutaminase